MLRSSAWMPRRHRSRRCRPSHSAVAQRARELVEAIASGKRLEQNPGDVMILPLRRDA
ncbi:MAG: hypothetical protein LH605_05815 [Microbacteriaceae bacterium]|nr:hypothetical protein [Microbacteriaceae bacterium]